MVERTEAGASCSTGGGACPTVGGVPLQFILMGLVVVVMLVQGAWTGRGDGDGPGLLGGMARLDRPYIAALWATGNADAATASSKVASLETAWSTFEEAWGEDVDGLRGGAAARSAVGTLIARAGREVGTDPAKAHETLESVRKRLRALRVANGLVYFPDRLTAYHEPMEAIVVAARSGGAAGPSPAAVATIRAALPRAEALWTAVEQEAHDNRIFELTPAMLEQRSTQIRSERTALDSLASALERGEPAAIGRAGAALKPAYARLVLLYGEREK